MSRANADSDADADADADAWADGGGVGRDTLDSETLATAGKTIHAAKYLPVICTPFDACADKARGIIVGTPSTGPPAQSSSGYGLGQG